MNRRAENSEEPAAGAASPSLAVNDLARSYQPRRVWAAAVGIGWNLAIAGLFVGTGAAERLWKGFHPPDPAYFPAKLSWIAPAYFGLVFAGWTVLNFPVELWFGYLEERQFGLAKEGVRAWARDWVVGTTQHGVMFVIGACLIVVLQVIAPGSWVALLSVVLLGLFVGTTYLAADLVPLGLFQVQEADEGVVGRLRALIAGPPPQPSPGVPGEGASGLPRVVIYSHPGLREFAGGIVGLGNRQVFIISRSTLEGASDALLRFVLLHDLGHRRYHHNLLAALAGWAWVVLGIVVGDRLIPTRNGYDTVVFASPLYVAFMAVTLSAWMAAGEPVLAYFGRRLEYQADRFYLRNGGNTAEMRVALEELARRNLARTEQMRRRETIFHPLPSVVNRLHAGRKFEGGRMKDEG